jgi:hypothetical protein
MENCTMTPIKNVYRRARRLGLFMLLAGMFALSPNPVYSSTPESETIAATATQGGQVINVTLIIDSYSTPSDMQVLSQAFQQGQDQALVTALSKTKAVGHCSIQGAVNYDVAFIQVVQTSTGRSIVFITNRPLQMGEAGASPSTESFDLAVGQFDLNDADPSKSTGFLFPASKLVVDSKGEFHYDLGGTPWSLAAVQDSRPATDRALAEVPQK